MAEIYDPLELYKYSFKDDFKQKTEQLFSELEEKAGIDVEANKELCVKIRSEQQSICKSGKRLKWVKGFRVFFIVAGILMLLSLLWPSFFYSTFVYDYGVVTNVPLMILVGVLATAMLVLAFTVLRSKAKKLKTLLESLQKECDDHIAEAYRQMAPLNALFTWDIPAKLFTETVPMIDFDPYFNEARDRQLRKDFGFAGVDDDEASVLFVQSGDVMGNPFVVVKEKRFTMGMKEYHGSLTIHWTEYETDENGKTRRVSRSETLHATIEKPCPEYHINTYLVYAHDAAPNLSFTRTPEGLEAEGASRRLRKKIKKLHKFSQTLDDDSAYTMMANKEFEAMFDTKDRDNEVEFRLLFTPLAQNNLIHLMRDKTEGYSGDFAMVKSGKINVISASHFWSFELDTDPRRFMGYCFEDVKKNFLHINEDYFRQIYFAFAPLLSIPLYQDARIDPVSDKEKNSSACMEWEAIANFVGPECFRHPDSITENILNTSLLRKEPDGKKVIEVTAQGFGGIERVEYVSKYGGDGYYHDVPVEWTEYYPVSQTGELTITDMPGFDKGTIRSYEQPVDTLRRSILIHR